MDGHLTKGDNNMGFMVYVLSILGWAFLLKILNKRFTNGTVLFISVFGMAFFMYVFGLLLNLFDLAAHFIIWSGIVLLLSCTLYNFKKKLFSINTLFSLGTIAFLAASCYIFIVLYDISVAGHDSYSHWATIVKELYYTKSAIVTNHTDYPMVFSMMQYGVVSVFGYNEPYLYMVMALLRCMVFIWLVDDFTKQQKWSAIIFIFLFLLIQPLLSGAFSIDQLLADGLLATLPIGFIIKWYKDSDDFSLTKLIPLFVCLSVMPSIKIMIGFIFSVVCVVLIVISSIIKIKNIRYRLSVIITSIILVLFTHCSYNIYYNIDRYNRVNESELLYDEFNKTNLASESKYQFKVRDIFLIDNSRTNRALNVANLPNEYKVDIIKQTIRRLNNDKLRFSRFGCINYFKLVLFMMIFNSFILIISTKAFRSYYIKVFTVTAVLIILYVIGVLLTYMFHMGSATEVSRYFSIPILMYGLILAYSFGIVWSEKTSSKITIAKTICFLVFITTIFGCSTRTLWSNDYLLANNNKKGSIEKHTLSVSNKIQEICSERDRVLIIDCYNIKKNSIFYYSYEYFCLPIYSTQILVNYEDDLLITKEQLELSIRNHRISKIILVNPNDEFLNDFGDILGLDASGNISGNIIVISVLVDGSEIYYQSPASYTLA